MAEKKDEPVEILTKEAKQRLQEMEKEIAQSRKMIEVLEELGQDVSALKANIEWAEKARKTLLEKG